MILYVKLEIKNQKLNFRNKNLKQLKNIKKNKKKKNKKKKINKNKMKNKMKNKKKKMNKRKKKMKKRMKKKMIQLCYFKDKKNNKSLKQNIVQKSLMHLI